jgi:hypothetical protein
VSKSGAYSAYCSDFLVVFVRRLGLWRTLILTGFTVSGRRFGLSLAGMAAGVAFRVSLRKRENMHNSGKIP